MDKPDFDKTLRAFLGKAFKYKEIGDYGVGGGAGITFLEAQTAIADAGQSINTITDAIAG